MKKNIYQNKWDREVVYCKDTDIPPISFVEFMILERLKEVSKIKNSSVLTMDEIFDGYTHTKSQRFELISRLIKKKIIRRKRIDHINHLYDPIPRVSFKESSEMKVYKPVTRRERIELIKELTKK